MGRGRAWLIRWRVCLGGAEDDGTEYFAPHGRATGGTQSLITSPGNLCFQDASSRCRTFKRGFGKSSCEVRSLLVGLAPPATPRSPTPSAGADFAEFIRGFQ
jgi:hypothetical protein